MNLDPLMSDGLDLSDTVEHVVSPYNKNSTKMLQITPKGIEACYTMRADGLSIVTIAHRLGIGEHGLRECMRRQPELNEALRSGHAFQQDELVRILVQSARTGFAPAAMFLLKTQHGFRENDPPQTTASNVVIHLPASMSLDDLKRLAEAGVSPRALPEPATMRDYQDAKEPVYDAEGNEVET